MLNGSIRSGLVRAIAADYVLTADTGYPKLLEQ